MPRVLIADDDPVSLRYLADSLALLGAQCAAADDGARALELARTERFDLVVLDLRLPGLDGAGVLARLRDSRDAASRATPVCAQSGDLPDATRRRLLAAGFAEAWQKPVALEALATALGRHAMADVDDAAGLLAAGAADTLAGLRCLFRDELPRQVEELARECAAGARDRAGEIVHKLKGGCRFCGLPRLLAALDRLDDALQNKAPHDAALDAVRRSAESALAALRPA